MRKVKIMLTAWMPREVFVRPGETFLGLLKRLSSHDWPLWKVENWYQNNEPVDRVLTILRDGDVLAGAATLSGSRILGDTPTCHLQLRDRPLFPLAFKLGETLFDALQRAPKAIQEAAFWTPSWRLTVNTERGIEKIVVRHASHIRLCDDIHVDALPVQPPA